MPWSASGLKERFDAKWLKDEASGCWIWFGARNVSGYGKISVAARLVVAHRVAWSLYVGEIPNGMVLDHKCLRRECVNPDHLELVTLEENTRRFNFHRWVSGRKAPEPIPKPPHRTLTLRERLDAKWIEGENGCWNWTRGKDRKGYSRIAINGVPTPAHRVAYELYVGPIAEGLVIDHLCRNPSCVNPEHLEPVTPKENAARGMAGQLSRERHLALTHCKRGHQFSGHNLIQTAKQRVCRTCRTEKLRKRDRSTGRLPNIEGLKLGATLGVLKRLARTHCRRGHEWTIENTGRQKGGRYCKMCDLNRDKSRKRLLQQVIMVT